MESGVKIVNCVLFVLNLTRSYENLLENQEFSNRILQLQTYFNISMFGHGPTVSSIDIEQCCKQHLGDFKIMF